MNRPMHPHQEKGLFYKGGNPDRFGIMTKGIRTIRPYVSVVPTEDSRVQIHKLTNPLIAGLPGHIRSEDYHCTIVYSSSDPPARWKTLKKMIDPLKTHNATVTGAEILQGNGDSLALVLLLESETLFDRHNQFHTIPNVVWQYVGYKPHITIAANPHKMPDKNKPSLDEARIEYRSVLSKVDAAMRSFRPFIQLTGEKLGDLDSDHVPMWHR